MHCCWFDTAIPLIVDQVVSLSGEESSHILKTLRMKACGPVRLIAAERLYSGEIVSANDGLVQVKLLKELPSPEAQVKVTLVQGLPKSDKLEWIVQKATELGVYQVLPVEMTRSVAKITPKDAKRWERLSRIAREATKQSGRAHVPQVLTAVRFSDALKMLKGSVYVAWEEADTLRLSQAIAQDQPQEITLIIGPEGGITPDEISQLEAIGVRTVTLGRRILRTETAGLCMLTLTMAALGEM